MARYRLSNLKFLIETPTDEVLKEACLRLAQLGAVNISHLKIVKKSLDARDKRELSFVYALEFDFDGKIASDKDLTEVAVEEKLDFSHLNCCFKSRPVVIGSGPAGMMAALALAEAGARPIVIERGAPVDERSLAVKRFFKTGELSVTTNVQFGEGGAGTFSDGKLMTGIKKDKFTAKVLNTFVEAGAPEEILYLAKPHIGTDNLVTVVANIRHRIEAMGGEYRFYEKMVDLKISNNVLKAVVVEKPDKSKYEIVTDKVFLALGHSARDTFQMLYDKGFEMMQKPFAVGLRIEHKQTDINLAQYGKHYYNSPLLGAADYKLVVHLENNRSIYTFCMCPGGVVVGATNLLGHVVTNGMSEFRRDKKNANAALLVNVDSRDFNSDHPLAGMFFQEKLETAAFDLGGGNYFAPAQTVKDFLSDKPTQAFGKVKPSYLPGVTPANLKSLFSEEIYHALQNGIRFMGRKLKGFDSPDAVLTAVETRSSSPVRIIRSSLGESNIKGVYPIGEGAGYAGGIVSASVDALKCVKNLSV